MSECSLCGGDEWIPDSIECLGACGTDAERTLFIKRMGRGQTGRISCPRCRPLEYEISFSMRWWVNPYLHAVVFFCSFTGMTPDPNKIAEFIAKFGVRYHFTKVP